MSKASERPKRLFLQWGNPGEAPGSVDASDVTWADSRVFPGDVEYVRADLAAAATARAEKAERALRLEQGRPAEGDLPNGWRHRGACYLSPRADALKTANHPVGYPWMASAWDEGGDEKFAEYYATAAEAIDAAQAALEGGDDE